VSLAIGSGSGECRAAGFCVSGNHSTPHKLFYIRCFAWNVMYPIMVTR